MFVRVGWGLVAGPLPGHARLLNLQQRSELPSLSIPSSMCRRSLARGKLLGLPAAWWGSMDMQSDSSALLTAQVTQ